MNPGRISAQTTVFTPYDAAEFPLWARDLRRADIVAFGTVPFTVFFSMFAVDSWRFAQHGWDFQYAPWPLKPAGAIEMDEDQRIGAFSAGLAAAAVLALVDYVILWHKRGVAADAAAAVLVVPPPVQREPWPAAPEP
jgi:hypothetical protein